MVRCYLCTSYRSRSSVCWYCRRLSLVVPSWSCVATIEVLRIEFVSSVRSKLHFSRYFVSGSSFGLLVLLLDVAGCPLLGHGLPLSLKFVLGSSFGLQVKLKVVVGVGLSCKVERDVGGSNKVRTCFFISTWELCELVWSCFAVCR
jgi:hypothetical protein